MKKMIVGGLLLGAAALFISGCNQEGVTTPAAKSNSATLTAVGQTSGQLASGTSFKISGSTSGGSRTTSGGSMVPGTNGGPPHPEGHFGGPLDGTDLLAPTNQLLAIIEAESAGDIRGIQMHAAGGATITNYNQAGSVVVLPLHEAQEPIGCSFSGGQFPQFDSLLASITKTVIDYGAGVTETHDTISITRSGQIVINRSGTASSLTEVVTFVNYTINGNLIEGTKTRVSALTRSAGIDTGSSITHVAGGKITFNDGTAGIWTNTKQRNSVITLDSLAHNRPSGGQINTTGSTAVTGTDGTVIYSHAITKTITENITCGPEHHGPVSGTIETIYLTNTIIVDFGNGSCANNAVTVTINGVTTTKTVGG